VQLIELMMRCSDPHIVKPLGALQSQGFAACLPMHCWCSATESISTHHNLHTEFVCAAYCRPGTYRKAGQRLVYRSPAF
jgi:hypothetical protein